MSSILEQIGFKKKTHIGISLSPNNFLELVCVDKNTKSVVKYASGNIKYNNAIKEIIDFEEFTEVLEGLFADAGLNPEECSATINLPNVHFGIADLANEAEEAYVLDDIQTDVSDLYVFKRNEPIISHQKLDVKGKKILAFSALQAKTAAKLLETFKNMQCDVVRIDTSYSSLLKAIQYCDRFNKYVQKEEKTSILLVTPNSCCTFYLEGNTIRDMYEEPLAVKSFSTEEVYATVTKIADATISKNNPSTLLVISETDEVNAELLATRLNFSGEKDFINKSVNTNEQFIEIGGFGGDVDSSTVSYMTIEAVGAAVSDYDEYPLDINFLPPDEIHQDIIEVGGYEVKMLTFIACTVGVAAVLGALIGFAVKTALEGQTDTISGSSSEERRKIEVFKKRIQDNEGQTTKNIFPVLKQIIDTNTNVVNVFNALSTEIPDTMYIKKFVTNSAGGIGIVGETIDEKDIKAFEQQLKLKKGDLNVMKVRMNTPNDIVPSKIEGGYTFEIKTENTDINLDDENGLSMGEIQNNVQNMASSVQEQPRRSSARRNNSYSNDGMTPPPPII